jgi:hypothetical protein
LTVTQRSPILTNMNNAPTTQIIGSIHVVNSDSYPGSIRLEDNLCVLAARSAYAVYLNGILRVDGQEVGFAGFSDY